MKVKTLIEELQKMNPEAEVKLNDRIGYPVLFVLGCVNEPETVWLQCESDCDMKSELLSWFDYYLKYSNGTECELYSNLLRIGVTIDCIRRYLGDEKADQMEKVCKEYNLIKEN